MLTRSAQLSKLLSGERGNDLQTAAIRTPRALLQRVDTHASLFSTELAAHTCAVFRLN